MLAFQTWTTSLSPVPTVQFHLPYSPPNDSRVSEVLVQAGTSQATTSGDVPLLTSVAPAQASHQAHWGRAASSSSAKVPCGPRSVTRK